MKANKIKCLAATFLLAVISSNQVKSFCQTGTDSLGNNTTYHDDSDSFEKAGYTFVGYDATGQIKNGKVYAIISSDDDFRSVFKLYRQKRYCEKTFASFDQSAERDRIICDKKIVKLLKKSIKNVIKMKPAVSRTVEIFKHIKNNSDVLKASEEWNGREEQALGYIDSYIVMYNALQSYEKEFLSKIKEKYDIGRYGYWVSDCLNKHWNIKMRKEDINRESEDFDKKKDELRAKVNHATTPWGKALAQKELDAFKENWPLFRFNCFRTRLEEAFEEQIQKGVDSLTYKIYVDRYVVSADNEVKIINGTQNIAFQDYYFFKLKDGRWASKISEYGYGDSSSGFDPKNTNCGAFVVFNKKLTRTMLPSIHLIRFCYFNYENGSFGGQCYCECNGETIPVDMYGEFVDKKYAFEITPNNLRKVLYIDDDNEDFHLYSAIKSCVKQEMSNSWVYSKTNKCSMDSLCSLGKKNAAGEMPSYDINDYTLVDGYDFAQGDNTRIMLGIPVTSPLVAKAVDYVSPAMVQRAKQQAREREAEERKICIRMPYVNFKKYYKHTIVRRGTDYAVAKYKNTYYYFYWDSYYRYYYLDHWATY